MIVFTLLLAQEHFHVRELKTGKSLLQEKDNTLVSIFSVSKIFLAYLSLKYLNQENVFQTKIFYDGEIEGKVLKGNLYLEGGGDPYLGANELLKIVLKIRERIEIIEGKFFLKNSNFPKITTLSDEFPLEDPYNVSLSPLNFEWNRVKTVQNFSFYSIDLIPDKKVSFNKKVQGEEWKGNLSHKKELPLKHPEILAEAYFKELLRSLIQINEKKLLQGELKFLLEEKSPNLTFMIKNLLEYSNNLIAEALSYRLIHKREPEEKKIKLLKRKLKSLMEKEIAGFKMEHASGLSSRNQIKLKDLTLWLKNNAFTFFENEPFFSLLPKKETLFLKDSYKIFAKSGTGHFSNNLAGYILTKKHHWLVFGYSYFDHESRKLLNLDPYDKNLIKKAKIFQEEGKKKQEIFLKNLYENY